MLYTKFSGSVDMIVYCGAILNPLKLLTISVVLYRGADSPSFEKWYKYISSPEEEIYTKINTVDLCWTGHGAETKSYAYQFRFLISDQFRLFSEIRFILVTARKEVGAR